jgi:hypothetical protein
MHGTTGSPFFLDRYDFDSDEWTHMAQMPQSGWKVGPGGALAYVADPYSPVPTGEIFALKGNGSREFYYYSTLADIWQPPAPPIPDLDGVTDGGALCFGGYQTRGGQLYADLYAFSGRENGQGAGRFFRYSFPVVANSFALPGVWTELPAVTLPGYYYKVEAGAALAWCGGPAAPGAVYALIGGGGTDGKSLFKYDPVAETWARVFEFDYSVSDGGAMTTGIGGTLWCFRGAGSLRWWLYDIGTSHATYFIGDDGTWNNQYFGAAICFNGSNVYAEVGEGDGQFKKFDHPSGSSPDGGGGQGRLVGISSSPSVSVKAERNSHTFCVANSAPGPVTLRIADASGRTVGSVHGRVSAQTAELVWNSGAASSGVYFYSVETPGASAGGKFAITR